ncbi:MAG: trimethylamine methyltransferase family protein [Gammaproteobacteria bacterium]|nr:trimethylamine methyltransferase family protein [Gammaproteobacteria bacterium]MDH3536538.1 trimethylamine methyltransferase family protein [Gammaproteobacteria bacterium]
MSENRRRRKGISSRDAMLARRSKPPALNPAPAGPVGGQYRPLTDPQLQQIHDTSLRMLAELGMGDAPQALTDQAINCGATINELGRLCFPRSMVEDIIAGACKSFVFHGRDDKHTFEVGGDRVYFGTGGAAVLTLDLDRHLYRPSTLVDLADFTRVVDTLPNIAWFTRCCVATDVPDIFELDVNTVYCLMRGTQKPVGTSFTLGTHVDPIVDMFDWIAGGEGRFAEKPFCKAHISPIISPMRYGADAFEVALACIRRGMPINAIVAAMSGATSPATIDGMLAASHAETLAALVMVNIFAPGYPMIFSNWPFVIDLRTGAFCGGGGEISILNAGAAQLANRLGLPSGVASSMSDAKAVDAQMGMEKALSSLACGLSGANMVYESAGMMASLLGVSFEAFLLDNEMLSLVYRMIRGIEVSEETLAFDAMKHVITGEGHFIGEIQTMEAMERDYFYPKLGDRLEPTAWAEAGAQDAWQRANAEVRKILARHEPNYIDAAVDAKIREKFNIRLP